MSAAAMTPEARAFLNSEGFARALQEARDEAEDLRLDYLDRLTWEDDGGPSLPGES